MAIICIFSDDSDSDLDVNIHTDEKKGEKLVNGIPTTKEERRSDKMRLFNFANVKSDRKWLCDVLISDTSDSSDDNEDKPITEEYFQDMLRQHVQEKKYRKRVHTKPEVSQLWCSCVNNFKSVFIIHKLEWICF